MKVAVIGAGAWGTALGLIAQQNGHEVTLWGHNAVHLAATAAARVNERYLPGVPLPADFRFEADLATAIVEAEVVVLAVPSKAFRGVAGQLAGYRGLMVSVTKGIEFQSGLTMCGVLAQIAPAAALAALSGPSLAHEVARGVPTAVVAASEQPESARLVQVLFHRPAFRVYTGTDLLGVELGGALKNVIAIAAGVCDGLGFGDNSKAALITRGVAEMSRLGVSCGARAETFAGLGGLGDLTVTCFSRHSRNRAFGERLGRGGQVDELLAAATTAIEGFPTARSAHELATRLGVPCPIIAQVYAMLYESKDPRRAVADLLSRDSKAED
ncbi:MAG TPA: NAD(P)H-dependent glycerol-3-phosphate dehydrogenase [Candidatus Limnocylindria bacterium]|nr:NAD(P)H-dependent glycerol-3-phosphate dehydrogenase [Candidatus Limnocylindria bacterium]